MRIGNVLITSFWSHCRAHPCILWRSKLRNTYCTLDFAKDCFRISPWNARLNVSIFFWAILKRCPPVLPVGIAVCFAVKLHTLRFFSDCLLRLIITKQVSGMIGYTEHRFGSGPQIIPCLTRGSRTHLPCLFDIAVFCMSIYQWVFFPPQATEDKEWLGGLD